MRRPLIAGNWKMNLTGRESLALAREIRDGFRDKSDRDVALFPNFIALAALIDALDGSGLRIGGQNCWSEENGAFTGEISAAILRSTGASMVILGHSERRHVLGESSALVNKKVQIALKHQLQPIVCVGETLAERESGRAESVIADQVRESLAGLNVELMRRVTIAYEPVWAIGTGKTATPEIAQSAHHHLRSVLLELFGHSTAEDTRILYGGSVKPNNIDDLMAMADIDGALVGGAALEAAGFLRIISFQTQRP